MTKFEIFKVGGGAAAETVNVPFNPARLTS
jgi:hypothetical protein